MPISLHEYYLIYKYMYSYPSNLDVIYSLNPF